MQTAFNLQNELEDLRELVINEGICPNCKEKGFLRKDKEQGEVYCEKCGFAQTVYAPQIRVSGVGNNKNCHHAPEAKLCHGDNLGSIQSDSDVYKIIRKQGVKNLGIRKIQIKNEIAKSQEKPITMRLKTYLSLWSKHFGWGKDEVLGGSLGVHAKAVGTILSARNDGKNSKELAKGIFVLNVQRHFGRREKTLEVTRELQAKKIYVDKARGLIELSVKIVI